MKHHYFTTRNLNLIADIRTYCANNGITAPTVIPCIFGYEVHISCTDEHANNMDAIIFASIRK